MTIVTASTGVVQDSLEIVPYIGLTGLYRVKAPYDKLIDSSIHYTVTGVTNISNYITSNKNPFIDIYEPAGDSEANYEIDVDANRTLITLQSSNGITVTIPNSVITVIPDVNGIKYSNTAITAFLGPLPEGTDTADLQTAIKHVIQMHLGVNAYFKQTLVGTPTVIPFDKHERTLTARSVVISELSNPLIDNIELTTTNTALVNKVKMLEAFIATNIDKLK